jgi:hypothetical protein
MTSVFSLLRDGGVWMLVMHGEPEMTRTFSSEENEDLKAILCAMIDVCEDENTDVHDFEELTTKPDRPSLVSSRDEI